MLHRKQRKIKPVEDEFFGINWSLIYSTLKNTNLFKIVVKTAFQQRRKMIKNSLSAYLTEDQIKEYGNLRPEQLTVNDFINISEYCFNTIK